MKRIAVLAATAAFAVSGLTVAGTASPADAQGLYYSSCDRLHRDYKYGVAKSRKAAQKQVRAGNHRPAFGKRAKKVYRTNHSRLDRDNDGTACEA